MTFTFGICTTYENAPQLRAVIESIRALNIPNVEIIIAGSYNSASPLLFDLGAISVVTDGWLPKKKNLVAKFARHEVLVLLHDYFTFSPNWFSGYEKFGYDWQVCSNPQVMMNGQRHFSDWTTWDSPIYPRYHPLDYSIVNHTKYQYISGQYFLVKRDFLRDNPFNEEMQPGSPEDVEWSLRIRNTAIISCNPDSFVYHNKIHRDCK